jgi:sialate O-acetylesterase
MKSKSVLVALLFAAPWLRPGTASAELKMPSLFSDNMVLQRDKPVPVWGWDDPGAGITVEFAGQKKAAKAGSDGKWMVKLDPLQVSAEPQTMTVTSSAGNKTCVISQVLVGEVWVCCGQSNMAMTVDGKTGWLYVGGIMNAKEVVQNSANPLLRQFGVAWRTGIKPENDCAGKWTSAGPAATAEFSAAGYLFAKEIQERLKIPVAIINSSFGGSCVENWMSRDILLAEGDPEYVESMNKTYDAYVNFDKYYAAYCEEVAAWEKEYGVNDPAGGPPATHPFAGPDAGGSDWKKVAQPGALSAEGFPNGGIIWYRAEVEIPAEMGSSWRLDFPPCKGSFTVYVNGVKCFEATETSGASGKASRPAPPKNVAKAGKNIIAARVHACNGGGGFGKGPLQVVPFDRKYTAIPLDKEWRCRAETEFQPMPKNAKKRPTAPTQGVLHWLPIPAHFNTMLHPVIPYAIRGATWYQGESNVGQRRYAKMLALLIKDWRTRWGEGDFPFYICQLPGYGNRSDAPGESAWAITREAQATVAATVPNTGIANLIDTCEDGDLHPLNKQDVGYRLALVALAHTYGVKDLAWSGPIYKSMRIDGGKAILQFSHADGGLVAKELPATYKSNLRKPGGEEKPLVKPSPTSLLQGFAVCGADRNWVWADAKIDGATVVVWSDKVPAPVAVRYAWGDHPVCNLYGKAGLPAFPFRTDDFPGSESGKKK